MAIPDPRVPAGVVAKVFRGGPASDYRVVVGAGGTLLSEHIPSGLKVPAVETAELAQRGLAGITQLAKLGRGGVLGAGAAAVAAGAAYAVYSTRKHHQDSAQDNAQGVEESTQDAPSPVDAPASILAPPSSNPFLFSQAPQAQPEAAPAATPRASTTASARAQAPSSLRPPTLSQTGTQMVPEVPEVSVGTADADEGGTSTSVDWSVVTPSEVAMARQEFASGAVLAAVERLLRLLYFLDELPGKDGSPDYPGMTAAPLAALTEFAESADLAEVAAVSAADVTQWRSRLADLASGPPELTDN